MLTHASEFLSCMFVLDDRDPRDAFPPTRTDRTFEDPSSKFEVILTLALGSERYGELSLALRDIPNDVVERMTDLKYAVCRACTDPDQFSERPACAGASQLL
jgi:hypothetical protein